MKTNLLLVALLIGSINLSAQNDLVIYGDATPGIEWHNFAGPTNVQEINNPTVDAINQTDRCISMNRPKQTGNSDEIGWNWEGALSESFSVPNIAEYNSISILVKKPYPGKVCLELQSPTGGSGLLYAEYTATDEKWQTLTFPINNIGGLGVTGLTKILIEIHREDENFNDEFEDCIMYVDEITLHKAMPGFYFNGEDKIAGGWLPFPGDEFNKRAKIVTNPDKSALNKTKKCLWIQRDKNDELFSGAINRNFKVSNLNSFKSIQMMVKKSIAGPVSLEIQSPREEKKQLLTQQYTNVGEWQMLDFLLPENVLDGQPLQIIILQIHAVDTKEDTNFAAPMDCYIDELYLSNKDVSSIIIPSNDKDEVISTEVYTINGVHIHTREAGAESTLQDMSKGVYIMRQTCKSGHVNILKVINQ